MRMIIDYNIARQLAQERLLSTLPKNSAQYLFELDIYHKLVSGEIRDADTITHYEDAK